MLCVYVFCFSFSMHKTVRPADTDKVANLAQDPKSLGIAAIEENAWLHINVQYKVFDINTFVNILCDTI